MLAEQVLEDRGAGLGRVDRLGDLGELEGVAEQDELRAAVPMASASASEICPASSTNR